MKNPNFKDKKSAVYYNQLNLLVNTESPDTRKTLHDRDGSVMNMFYRVCAVLRRAATVANRDFEENNKRKNRIAGTSRLRGEQSTLGKILLTISETPQVKLILGYQKKNKLSLVLLEKRIELARNKELFDNIVIDVDNFSIDILCKLCIVKKALEKYNKSFKKKSRRVVSHDWGHNFEEFKKSKDPIVTSYFFHLKDIDRIVNSQLATDSLDSEKLGKKLAVIQEQLLKAQRRELKSFRSLELNQQAIDHPRKNST